MTYSQGNWGGGCWEEHIKIDTGQGLLSPPQPQPEVVIAIEFPPPPPSPPLCPCQRKGETSPWWVHLWSLWGASAPPPFFLPSSSLCWGAVKSSEDSVCPFWSLIAPDCVSGLFHPHAQCFMKPTWVPEGPRRHPTSSLSQVVATSSLLIPSN